MPETAAFTASYAPDPRLAQARENIARQLGVSADDVAVRIGNDSGFEGHCRHADRVAPKDGAARELVVSVHKQGLDLDPAITEDLRARLGELRPLADNAQMMPQGEQALELRDAIAKATAGTNFNPKLLEWPGFKPDVITNGWEISDYAAQNVQSSAYGVQMNLHFAHAKGEDPSVAAERFTELTRGRIPAIKEILTERVIKYARANIAERGLNAQDTDHVKTDAQAKGQNVDEALKAALAANIAQAENDIRAGMAKLAIGLTNNRNNILVTLRSPEQEDAFKKAGSPEDAWKKAIENAEALNNTNPLTSNITALTLTRTPATETAEEKQPQLNKALARSFLFDKDKNIAPDALELFGRQDFKAAFIKEAMLRVLPKHPEKAQELRDIINSELFKNHGKWHAEPGKAGMAKPEPSLRLPGNDTMEMAFQLKVDRDPEKNTLLKVVNGLASQQVQEPARQLSGAWTQRQDTAPVTVTISLA